jgi:hypothetical protein
MAFGSLTLRPGVTVEATPTLNEAGYSSTNLVRFQSGLVQKIGGWVKYYPLTVRGIPRDLHAWQDLNETGHLAVGSTTQFGIITGTNLQDITPQTKTTNFAPKFTTTLNSTTVTVDDSNISTVTVFDSVFFNTPVAVGGIVLSGLYPIDLVTGATTYRITAATAATSAVTNGGSLPSFTTTSGSATVTVTLTAHGLSIGDRVVFQIPTSVGGITVLGSYPVITIGGANTFTITANAQATSGATVAMNSSQAQLVYYITLGPPAGGIGYGVGGYGLGGYGTGVVPSVQTGTPITATDWTLDNWGEVIMGCPLNGGIYYWSPTGGFSTASLISTGPLFNTGMFVSTQAQILVAYGSSEDKEVGVDQDALLIRNSDMEDYTVWTESLTNQARRFRIPTGSRIVGGSPGAKFDLIWTDLDLWMMEYVGFPLVYTYNQVATSCGLVAEHAQCTFRGVTYWMGQSNFFAFGGGGVQVMPCSVWDAVFQDLDQDNVHKIRCCPSTPFNEITWEYPSLSGGTGENDKAVTYNVVENVWYPGVMPGRSAWIDQSVLGNPIGSTSTSIIYQHEEGYDADGEPITATTTTGYFYIGEGEDYAFVDQWYPDFKYGTYAGSQSAQVSVTFNVVDYPGETPRTYGPYQFSQSSTYIPVRFRGRQASITLTSSDSGSFWRLGKSRYRYSSAGRR